MFANPGVEPVVVQRDYDVFVAVCQTFADLLYVNAIRDWKNRCRTSVVWIDEMWVASVPRYKNWLKALDQFEHVCVGSLASAGVLSGLIGRRCHWMPGGVDALRFAPDAGLERVVDVYSVGRRWDGIHQALMAAAEAQGLFYIYDTFRDMASAKPFDHAEHRRLYANIAKRSQAFVVAPAKMDLPADTQGQAEIGYRYYEGAAAGAVLIGQKPLSDSYRRMFPWPDAVMEIRPDGSDVIALIESLRANEAAAARIGRRNARESLLRHDWVYRWKLICELAGLAWPEAAIEREARLQELASQLDH
jgi:hypothetical protein